ncbi:MAG: hypothetical protein L6R37_003370 [Teloschistes peruensis]|nr:MAG: hypothetical protein L6R37_003370 [Teloschistes peruensis]
MKEIRLLHFYSYVDEEFGDWWLSKRLRVGIPISTALDRVSTEAFVSHSQKPELGLLDALADALGEGGPMNGWQVHNIGQMYIEDDKYKIMLVMVVRETVEVTKTAVKKEQQDSVTTDKVKKAKKEKRGQVSGSANGAEELGATIDGPVVKKRRLKNDRGDTT